MKNETQKRIIEVLKVMFTLSDEGEISSRILSIVIIPYFCLSAIFSIGTEITTRTYTAEGMIFGVLFIVCTWLLGYSSRKPDPNRKGLKKWLKICILNYKIFILNRKCNKYPDLKKYRGNPDVKKIVKAWRSELKELERELSSILKS